MNLYMLRLAHNSHKFIYKSPMLTARFHTKYHAWLVQTAGKPGRNASHYTIMFSTAA